MAQRGLERVAGAAEAAWDCVRSVVAEEELARFSPTSSGLRSIRDDVAERWLDRGKREFVAAWHHLSAMLDDKALRDEYAAYLTSPSSTIVRRALEALSVDVGALLGVARSLDGVKAFRSQSSGIEALLVACMGHSLARPRTASVKLLNALYDGHDWGVTSPLEPAVALTGDRFAVDVWVDRAACEAAGESLRFIVAAPAFAMGSTSRHSSPLTGPAPYSPGASRCVSAAPDVVQSMHPAAPCGEEAVVVAGEAGGTVRVTATHLRLALAPFPRCGFYDWRLVAVAADGSARVVPCYTPVSSSSEPSAPSHLPEIPLSSPAQGRFIVHRAGLGDETWHEVVVDLEGMTYNDGGGVVRHGTFESLAGGLKKLRAAGVSNLIVVGAMERDNGWGEREPEASAAATPVGGVVPAHVARVVSDRRDSDSSEFGFIELSGETGTSAGRGGALGMALSPFELLSGGPLSDEPSTVTDDFSPPSGMRDFAMRPDANPHCVVDRITPNRMLGGAMGFVTLIREAAALGMRVVVQAESAVSASRPHRKYRGLYCHTLDTRGQAQVHAGTDARENQWEDTQLLNYRLLETWELLVSEAKTLVSDLGVGGLYLPDAQSFPFIMGLDSGELWRRDVDGEGHYSPREILEGTAVIANAEVGYWTSSAALAYPNPLLVKLVRALWSVDPTLAVVGESHWGRAGSVARSGILPHGLDLITAIAATLGRLPDKTGAVRSITIPADIGPVHLLRALLSGEADGYVPPQLAPRGICEALSTGAYPHPLRALVPSPAGALPRGAARFLVRSLCSTRLPYPTLLLGRSAWTAVDLLYTLPGVPCTFGSEASGTAYRVDIAGTYAPNAVYLEQERRKKEKREHAEKHNRKFWERAQNALGGSGPSVAGPSVAGSSAISPRGSLVSILGAPSRPLGSVSALHATQSSATWASEGMHVGAGGVVPAAPPALPSALAAARGTGFSSLDLQALGNIASGLAIGVGRSAIPGPSRLGMGGLGSVAKGMSGSSSSPALNMMLLGGPSGSGSFLEGGSEGMPWGTTPLGGQHTVQGGNAFFGFGAPVSATAHPLPPGEERDEEEEGEGEGEGEEDGVGMPEEERGEQWPEAGRTSAFGFAAAGGSARAIAGAGVAGGKPRAPPLPPSRFSPARPSSLRVQLSVGGTQVIAAPPPPITAAVAESEGSRIQSWVRQDGLKLFGANGGGWHEWSEGLTPQRVMEDRLRAEVGPEYGFDTAQIAGHYEHRRAMRARYGVLRDGELTVLVARHRFGEHGHVFTFARSIPGVVAIVALNFNGHPSTIAVDASPLAHLFGATTTADASASVQHLLTSSLSYGNIVRQRFEAAATAGAARLAGALTPVVTSATAALALPSLNLRGGVWEVRNVFDATQSVGALEFTTGARMLDGSSFGGGQATFSDSDGPLVAILASDEAAYAPTMTTLAPHRGFCWMFAACAGGGSTVRSPASRGVMPGGSMWDKDAEVGSAAMQWLFASSVLRLQSMLRLKEVGVASFVVSRQDVEAAGGYEALLKQRNAGGGGPWISPGEMLKDEEVQAGVRHNLVYSLLRGVVKRTYRSLQAARKAEKEGAVEEGALGPIVIDSPTVPSPSPAAAAAAAASGINSVRMAAVLTECGELLEAALRVLVTHLHLREAPMGGTLLADPLPPLHGAMHGGRSTPIPAAGAADPHASWYAIDPEVGVVLIRSALFLAVKDVVAQQAAAGPEGVVPPTPKGSSPVPAPAPTTTSGPGSADVSDEDAVLSALCVKGLVRVARGTATGLAAQAKGEQTSGQGSHEEASGSGPSLAAASARELSVRALASRLVQRNTLGPLVFITPELGKWSTVGGLGVMVDELSVGLAELGAEVVVISPYYHVNRKGVPDYLAADGINYTSRNVVVWVGGERVEMGVHEGVVGDVRVLFLHNPLIFPKPYPPYDAYHQTRVMAAFAKGALELLCQWHMIPSLVVTNDWFTGLVPAFARNPRFFGSAFNRTDFLHIAHNLNPDYEGRLWPDRSQGTLSHLHELDSHLLVDPYWTDVVINPTRAALLCSDTWATVSRSYRAELLAGSPLRALLRLGPHPFAHPNGIPVRARAARLGRLPYRGHNEAKAALQAKYFRLSQPNLTIPLFAFVGRITLQKGVHLILESVDALLSSSPTALHFLVGGMASESDEYGRQCAGMMAELRARHPTCFWADPNLFFTDGDLVNLGADFCMMPSVFEPGGIVQQEFFVAGTPVIAFKTGGLKDTVSEWRGGVGNGFVFETHNAPDFQWACRRALEVFRNPLAYERLRSNARASVMDLSVVCQAWYREFHRIRRCLPPPPRKPVTRVSTAFSLKLGEVPGATRSACVFVAGSFNGWSDAAGKRLDLTLNPSSGAFEGAIALMPGVYTYKFVLVPAPEAPAVGGAVLPLPAVAPGTVGAIRAPVWCTKPSAPLADDGTGNVNNVVDVARPASIDDLE